MNRFIKKRQWFSNKVCYFCKKQAILFRLYKNYSFVLCDKKDCNKRWMEKVGMFGNILSKLK